jgi:hypothetical protein
MYICKIKTPKKKFTILLFLYFFTNSLNCQNLFFKLNDNIYCKNYKDYSPRDLGFRISFSSLDNGKYLTINDLIRSNKDAKTMAYIKEFDVYVVKKASGELNYYNFKEAFPKGGFYKDGALKTIFGQKSERYTLDNDVLDFKIWVTKGVQEEHKFVDFLNKFGLLRNLPNNKKIIAFSILGMELDFTNLSEILDNSLTSSMFRDFLDVFNERKDTICEDSILLIKDSIYTKTITFPYKVEEISVHEEHQYKKKKVFNATFYSNLDGTLQLYIYSVFNNYNINAMLYDYNLMKVYECELIDNNVKIITTQQLYNNKCNLRQPKFISKVENYNSYFLGKENEFYLVKYQMDEKKYTNFTNKYDVSQSEFQETLYTPIRYSKGSKMEFLLTKYSFYRNDYPIFANWNNKNGFIKNYMILDKDLNQVAVTRTLEKGTFTFNFTKQ